MRRTLTAALRALTPPPKLKVSDWADRYRVLSPEDSAEPGDWDTSRAEYQRGVMDAMNDPKVHTIVVPKAHQVGWTAMLGNCVGFHMHQDPCPLLVLQPTLEMAETWSKKRLAPMLRDTPALRGLVGVARSKDSENTLLEKSFAGGYLAIVGANSPSALASRPIRIVLADECDRYPASAGAEGDPLTLAKKRQTNFWNRKLLLGSTPVHKASSVIWREWLRSDQRKYFVPCPHCAHPQTLRWEQVRWDKNQPDSSAQHYPHNPATAYYLCESCGCPWNDAERWQAINKGTWIATAPFNGMAGFHITGFLSPWVTLEQIVAEFLGAKDDPTLLQPWVNTVLGEPWDEGERISEHDLMNRLETWGHPGFAPAQTLVMTAGVDLQDDRIEVEVVAWGDREESWSTDYRIFYGDPSGPQLWRELDDFLQAPIPTVDGRSLRLSAVAIDSGGHHTQTVYNFCADPNRVRRKVWAIKGMAGAGRPVWPKRATRLRRGQLFIVGVDAAKESVYARLKHTAPGPGYCHFPEGRDKTYFEQLTAETIITKHVKGFATRVWEKRPSARNEALDCRVYAYAALLSLNLVWAREVRKHAAGQPAARLPNPDAEIQAAIQAVAPVAAPPRKLFTRRATTRSSML